MRKPHYPMAYPVFTPRHNPYANMHYSSGTREMGNAVKVVAGATTTMVSVGTLGALGIGFMGALKS